MSTQPIYALRVADVYTALATTPEGLPPEEAPGRQSLYGLNRLTEPPPPPRWQKLTVHITHPMALVLLLTGLLALGDGRFTLSLVIWIVVLLNAAFSFWQEYRAEQAIAALKHLLPAYARVIRAGVELKLPAAEVTPGDLLVLAEGDNIPADARVVEEYGLRLNTASLTGEAMPARKTADASLREGLTEIERPNLIFAGTSVVSGTGRAVVFAVGMMTQFGRIANLTQNVPEEPSPLQQNIRQITRIISWLAVGLGGVVFVVSKFDLGFSWIEAFFLAMGLMVAIIPEGLLPTVTLTLAMAVQRLTRQGVLVKQLAMVETLGTTSVICTDKSGTLTQNQMTVRDVWVCGQRLSVSGVGYDPAGEIAVSQEPDGVSREPYSVSHEPTTGYGQRITDYALHHLLLAGSLCNNSRLTPPTAERPFWSSLGDQTEVALRVLARKGGLDETQASQTHPRRHELPFDARRKRMSTIHHNAQGEVAYVKGAPREVLQLCTQILWPGRIQPLDDATRAAILQANDDYARRALRVLALAYRPLPPRQGAYTAQIVEQDLIFLGLVGMMDPPRPEVATAVQTCHTAGIRLVMITGDYGLTAESLARRVGLLQTATPHILTGAELDELDDAALHALLSEELICARMAPEHKLRLVAAFQARGDVVAVSGDGVNDAPALATATIGIAMGAAGTDVALETADVVLMSDDLKNIPYMIGLSRATRRTLFVNLGFAMFMILLMLGTIFFFSLPLPLAVIGHEGGTVLVSLNGLRLLVYRDKELWSGTPLLRSAAD